MNAMLRRTLSKVFCTVSLVATASVAQAHVTVLSPNGGETLQAGDQVLVEWTVAISHTLLNWDMWYSTTGPSGPWITVAMDLPPGSNAVGSPHSYLWTVPDTPSTQVRVRLRMDNTGTDYYDISDGNLTIVGDCCGTAYCEPAEANSTGVPATIAGSGSDVANDNNFSLTAASLPPNQFGYFLASETQGFVQNPAGSQGNLCLGSNIGRFTQQIGNSNAAGEFTILVDLSNIPVNPAQAVLAGESWSFQCWYRDVNPTATSNFTPGLEVIFQ